MGVCLFTLKMRSLLSEKRARPPLKWRAQVRRRTLIATPTALTVAMIGNLTTGGAAILERENGRERKRGFKGKGNVKAVPDD